MRFEDLQLVIGAVASVLFLAANQGRADGHPADSQRSAQVEIPLAAVDGGPRRWQVAADGLVAVRELPSADAALTKTLDDGALLSNLGCRLVADHVWCRVATFDGVPRGFVPLEILIPAAGPDGSVPVGPDNSRIRARKGDFDAQSQIRCAQEQGQQMGECTVFIARDSGGDAAVVARFPNGFARTLFFTHGSFMSADATMSGSGTDTDWQKTGDLHVIRVDDQRYELPDHVIFGG